MLLPQIIEIALIFFLSADKGARFLELDVGKLLKAPTSWSFNAVRTDALVCLVIYISPLWFRAV